MIKPSERIITNTDKESVLAINSEEKELEHSFVTDGKFLYYVDGVNSPLELRALSIEEQFENLEEIALAMNKTKKQLLAYMLKQNKDVDYQNCYDTECKTKKGVDKWWDEHLDDFTIFKVYDEYYGIAELIAEI